MEHRYISCNDWVTRVYPPQPHLEVTEPAVDEPTCPTKPALLVRIRPFTCSGQPLTQRLDVPFWDTIFSADIASAEGLSNIETLVNSPSEIGVARNLWGDKAQKFIDLIDQVSDLGKRPLVPTSSANHEIDFVQFLALPCLDQKLFRRCSRLLYKVCKARGMLPASYSIQPELTHVGEIGWGGGFADVSKGEHRGHSVAVKHLKIGTTDEFDKVFKVSSRTRLGMA